MTAPSTTDRFGLRCSGRGCVDFGDIPITGNDRDRLVEFLDGPAFACFELVEQTSPSVWEVAHVAR